MAKNNSPEISRIVKLLNSKYEDCGEIFQEALKQIKPFRKLDKKRIPLSMLEKLIYTYELKYAVMINYICPVFNPEVPLMYSVTIRETKEKKLIQSIYGTSIYETMCKIALFYYMEITLKGTIGLKDWTKRYES